MNTDQELNGISGRIIGCAFEVAHHQRPGYLEKVYDNALVHELRKQRLLAERQVRLDVHYDGVVVGQYIADVVIENMVMIELKATESITREHMAQALNYLATTGLSLCLILNFGTTRVQIQRVRL